jgi:diguanylate cyclase (GGDEF)-like protein
MEIPLSVVLVGVAVLAIIAMAAALGAAWLAGRRHAEASLAAPAEGVDGARPGSGDPREPRSGGLTTDGVFAIDEATIDRVTRIVSLLFIAAAGAVTAISPGRDWDIAATYLLLAVGTLFVVFVGDLLKERMQPLHRYALQATGAIAFLGLLTGFTGGLDSPFVIGYFLLVGGAALAWDGAGPVALALGSGLSYAFVGLIVVLSDGPDRPGGLDAITAANLTWILFVLASLLLLAYLGTVAGRAQRRARDAALRLSRHDALTGLYNRGAFFTAVEREIRRTERSGRGFCLLMLDLDDMKPVNDMFGHPAGDQLLRAITEVIQRTVRASDLAGRYGGDEFVVLLPETDADGGFVVAEKLRRDIANLAIRVQDRSIRTSVSLGMVTHPEDGRTIDELLSAVDAAMYEAKRRGKNQIVGYTTRTERVATAIGSDRVPSPPPRSRSRVEESRTEELGLARPAGRETPESTWAPPSGREEAVGGPVMPDPSTVPAAAPVPSPGGGTPEGVGGSTRAPGGPTPVSAGPAEAAAEEGAGRPDPSPGAASGAEVSNPVRASVPVPDPSHAPAPPSPIAAPGAGAPVVPVRASVPVPDPSPASVPVPDPSHAPVPPSPIAAPGAGAPVVPDRSGLPATAFAPGAPPIGASGPVVKPPVKLHDDDPLDAAAPAYPEPTPAAPDVQSAPAGGMPDPVPAADPVTPGQAAAAGTARAPFPRLPSMPSLPAQPVHSSTMAASEPGPVRPAAPVEPRDAAAAGRPPVPTGDVPWTTRPAARGSNAPRGARPPAGRQYVVYPPKDDQPR